MAGPNTTATLARMPTEILCIVGPYLGDGEVSNITRVSKRLRQIFIPLHFRDVLLRGDMGRLSLRLASFLDEQSVSMSGPMCQHVQFVRFRITGTYESDQTTLRLATETTIELIGDFFQKSSSLRSAAFHFWTVHNDPQQALFTQLLGNTNQWSGLRSVYLRDTNLATSRAIIHHYVPEALQAVRITSCYGSEEYNILRSHCPTLKRLYLNVGLRSYGNTARLVIPSMDHDVVDAINADFSQLEWLVLKEGALWPRCISRPSSQPQEYINHLNQIIDNLIKSLQAMPHLTRFSCTLARQREVPDVVLDPSYSALVLRISHSVPRLEHLCIASHPRAFYRGTKTAGQTFMEVRREKVNDVSQKYRFPTMLID